MADISAFVASVRRYREFIEHAKELPIEVRMQRAHSLLLELYVGGLQLPEVDVSDIDSGPAPKAPAGWEGFGKLDWYFEIFDPYEKESSPVTGDLSDDLLDVYRDLCRGLDLWDGDARSAAIWEWHFHFHNHWGDHAADAMRALHWARKRLP